MYKMAQIIKKKQYKLSKSPKEHILKGGGLKSNTLQLLLEATYTGNEVDGFAIDKSISTKESRVFVSNSSPHVIVAHIGTYNTFDWGNNLAYAVGGDFAYKQTPRFKRAERVQKLAEQKYGAENITTTGHSQGALLAQLLGKNTFEIISLNGASRPQDLLKFNQSKNQYNVRSEADIVSLWRNPLQRRNETTIKKKSNNPILEHKPNVLSRLDKNKIIGKITGLVS
jgi:hypothetical protein